LSGRHWHHIGGPEKGSSKAASATSGTYHVRVLATSNDPVRLSFLTVLLADAGIVAVVLDAHTSATEGSIGAIPRRLMVAAEDERRARRVLAEAGEI
jgi:hypothetical protein